jgi:nucleoside-diphosphate-sugar epimerase
MARLPARFGGRLGCSGEGANRANTDMKILVTGGAGFIGRWLVKRLLDDGHGVTVIDNLSNGSAENLRGLSGRSGFESLKIGDIKDAGFLKPVFRAGGFGICYHLAASINVQDSIDDPRTTFENDVVGTFNVLELCREHRCKMLFMSTCMVYDRANGSGGSRGGSVGDGKEPVGDSGENGGGKVPGSIGEGEGEGGGGKELGGSNPGSVGCGKAFGSGGKSGVFGARGAGIDEKHALKAASPYAGSKIAAESLALSYWHAYRMPVTVVRPFNTYGPYQKAGGEGGVVSIFIKNALAGRPLRIYGSGEQTRDLLYVEDCAAFVALAGYSRLADGEILNAGLGRDITINELAGLICDGGGSIEHVGHIHPQSEIMKLLCDSKKARELLGWSPSVGIEEGILRTREWIGRREN